MPRKSAAQVPTLRRAVEEFEALSRSRHESARVVYDGQDAKTKKAIDRIATTLRQHANGTVNVRLGGKLVPIEVGIELLGFNLLWLAVEVVKDMYAVGLRVAEFEWSPATCISCGAPIKKRRR